ncbi:MAG: alkaline phosphatase family protein [Clostridia bacterium]|nr:alkaline phosphatase family protein [Clostridia bacterium]
MKKVLLALIDGMRPDGMIAAGHPFTKKLMEEGASSLNTTTVFPSVTLPCHMSLFHSVPPTRHGTTTNTYMPQVRPVNGICEQLAAAGKTSAIFYNWEQQKDLARPGSLCTSAFFAGRTFGYDVANEMVTDAAISCVRHCAPDFIFLYLGYTDEEGHAYGWMGEEYLASIRQSFDCIERAAAALGDEYTVIVTADHGGHDRGHGPESPEDMTIPLIVRGADFPAGSAFEDTSILDIAPTIAELVGAPCAREWEGKSLVGRAK